MFNKFVIAWRRFYFSKQMNGMSEAAREQKCNDGCIWGDFKSNEGI